MSEWQPIGSVPCEGKLVVLYDVGWSPPRVVVTIITTAATPDSMRLSGWTHWCWPPPASAQPSEGEAR